MPEPRDDASVPDEISRSIRFLFRAGFFLRSTLRRLGFSRLADFFLRTTFFFRAFFFFAIILTL